MDAESDLGYIQNFWVPSLGHRVENSETAEVYHIEDGPLDTDGVQYLFSDQKIHFIQDYFWHPNMAELYGLFERLGVEVYEDQVKWKRHFLNKPVDIAGAAETLRSVRQLSIRDGNDIIRELPTFNQ